LFIDADELAPFILLKMQNQSSLTHCWCSFSWCGRGYAAIAFALKGGQYSIYVSVQPCTTQITNNAKPKIVNTLLTLIFMMGQGACSFLFVLQRRPIYHLWQPAAIHNSHYQRSKTKNRWYSIYAYVHDAAVSMSLSHCPTKTGNTRFMTTCSHSQLWLPMMQNQNSLTLRWC
jgi:hypothetical protein